jgi:hypothetical protein
MRFIFFFLIKAKVPISNESGQFYFQAARITLLAYFIRIYFYGCPLSKNNCFTNGNG